MGFIDGRPRAKVQVALNTRGRKGQEETVVEYLSSIIPICSHGRVTAQFYLCYLLSRKTYFT